MRKNYLIFIERKSFRQQKRSSRVMAKVSSESEIGKIKAVISI